MKFKQFLVYFHAVARAQETDGDDQAAQQENVAIAYGHGMGLGFTEMQVAEHIGDENLAVKDLREKIMTYIMERAEVALDIEQVFPPE